MKKEKKFKKISIRLISWMTFFVIPLYFVFSSSQIAQAGLFSFVFDWINTGQASIVSPKTTTDANSQTMVLLSAATNQDPNPDNQFEALPMDHDTLLPDIAVTNSTSTNNTLNTKISIYTVHEGDSLASIAKLFSVSVNTILWANSITSKTPLTTGEVLVILPISGINYTVKKGDTLSGLAKKFGADHYSDTLNDILTYNDLDANSVLVPGDTIMIPDAEQSFDNTTISPIKTPTTNIGNRSYGLGSGQLSRFERLLDNISNYKTYPSCSVPTAGCYYARPILPSEGIKSQGLHNHNAIDIAASVGTPIHASADGTIIVNRINGTWNGGYGNYVVISHSNGTQTLYAHMLTKNIISTGQNVKQGDIIGYVGMTGHTTGPHVHFEIRGAMNTF